MPQLVKVYLCFLLSAVLLFRRRDLLGQTQTERFQRLAANRTISGTVLSMHARGRRAASMNQRSTEPTLNFDYFSLSTKNRRRRTAAFKTASMRKDKANRFAQRVIRSFRVKTNGHCLRFLFLQVLEDGIAEVVGPATPVDDDALSPSSPMVHTGSESEVAGDSTLADPILTLGISMGDEEERTLLYYAGQVNLKIRLTISAEGAHHLTPRTVEPPRSHAVSGGLPEI